MGMRLLLASQNPGKLAEMRQLVTGLPFDVVGPRDLGVLEAPAETGATFLANAELKARHYSKATGCLTVADDSGLSVDALGGAPGLFSSRFGGEGASDDDRNRLLLAKLAGVDDGRRGARFTSAVAIARGDDILFEVERHVDGRIAREPRGRHGFGYDPIFIEIATGMTFGEIAPSKKEAISHRGQAFQAARKFLAGLPTA